MSSQEREPIVTEKQNITFINHRLVEAIKRQVSTQKRIGIEHGNNASYQSSSLNGGLVRQRIDSLGFASDHGVGGPGLNSHSLEMHTSSLLLRSLPLGGVILDTVNELLAALGVLDVLDTDVDTLLKVAVADTLVDDDPEGRLGDVVNDTGLSVVDLVGHTEVPVSASPIKDHSEFHVRLRPNSVSELVVAGVSDVRGGEIGRRQLGM